MPHIPPRSPYGLIQEDLWPDEWKILIACVMLNCTSRKQVEKVAMKFFMRWSTAEALLLASESDIQGEVASLGFKVRRTKMMLSLSKAYISSSWTDASELPGIGEYGSRSWRIFCNDDLGAEAPKDHALTKYWHWRKKNDKEKNDRTGDEGREEDATEEKTEDRFIDAA